MPTIPPIPPEIARPVRAVFGSSNLYLQIGDQLDAIVAGLHVTGLLATERPTTPGVPVLAFAAFFQYAEGLADVQAADALRHRPEWKYALHLPVIAPVVPQDALCRFRQALWVDPVALREMEGLVLRVGALVHGVARQVGVREMLASICSLNRLVWLYGAMDEALEMLAREYPDRLGAMARPYWYTLYRAVAPQASRWANRDVAEALSLTIGADICYLLRQVTDEGDGELASRRELLALDRVWGEQFEKNDTGQIGLRPYCSFCAAGSPGKVTGCLSGLCAGGGEYGEN